MPAENDRALLRARDLTVDLEGDDERVRVLDGVSFELAPGEVVDVVGPSGSGKSTLLRALARLLPRFAGDISLDGRPAGDVDPKEWRAAVTLVPQKLAMVPGNVRDNLLLPWRFKVRSGETRPPEEDLRRGLDELGLEAVSLDREAERLSVGQQARLAFARVWLASPRVLLLDEVDAALDDESASRLSAAVVRFAAAGGRMAQGEPAGVVRVRHRADDGNAVRRLRLAGGHLVEVDR